MAIAPLSAMVLAWLLLWQYSTQPGQDWRSPILSASVLWSLILTGITEGLNVGSNLTATTLFFTWLIIDGALLGLLLHRAVERDNAPLWKVMQTRSLYLFGSVWLNDRHDANTTHLNQPQGKRSALNLNAFTSVEGLSIVSIGVILALTAVVAIVAPPNNWDSMTYHMSRIVNWIQDQNVNHYPTHILRQLDMAPWAGYAILHAQLLSGGDRFANFVQWCSMAGCVLGVSLIAKQLGANARGQVLASLFCATIPMGILQATTTQNDYVISFWMVCLAWSTLLLIKTPRSLHALCMLAFSLGLAILTKATAYIYALPFGVWFVFLCVKHYKAKSWQPLLLVGIPTIFLNVSFWLRNVQVFGDPLGVAGKVTQNHLFTPQAIASNLVRNLSIHLGSVFESLNDAFDFSILAFHDVIGLSSFDPRTTYENTAFNIPVGPIYDQIVLNEDTSGNFIHLLLIIAALLIYITRNPLHSKLRHHYLVALLSGFLVYNIILAWQPWASRLHLPLFVLFSSIVGCILSERFQRHAIHYALVAILFVSAIPYTLFSLNRPLLSNPYFLTNITSVLDLDRSTQYFNRRVAMGSVYRGAVEFIESTSCRNIGLDLGFDSWEYPIWMLFQDDLGTEALPTFKHVNVTNPSARIPATQQPSRQGTPCAVMAVEVDQPNQMELENQTYRKAWTANAVSIYLAEPAR